MSAYSLQGTVAKRFICIILSKSPNSPSWKDSSHSQCLQVKVESKEKITRINWIGGKYIYYPRFLIFKKLIRDHYVVIYIFLASQASTDNEELLQFPLELCSDSLPSHPFPPAKGWLSKRKASTNTSVWILSLASWL